MSALTNAKAVSRSDLIASPQSSRASTPDIDALEKLRAGLDFEFVETAPQHVQPTDDRQEDEEEELEFQLFAPTTTTAATAAPAQKIRLRSPSLESKDPGFVTPSRPLSYYHTGEIDPVRAKEYADAAVTGAEVLRLSKQPCPGCVYPWKVISIPVSQAKRALTASNPASEAFLPDAQKKCTRLGKKARIKKRQKLAAEKVKKEEKAKANEEKELADRAKKAKRNRDKKLKKRARDKAKKAAGGETGDDAASSAGSGSDDDDDDDVDVEMDQ